MTFKQEPKKKDLCKTGARYLKMAQKGMSDVTESLFPNHRLIVETQTAA